MEIIFAKWIFNYWQNCYTSRNGYGQLGPIGRYVLGRIFDKIVKYEKISTAFFDREKLHN